VGAIIIQIKLRFPASSVLMHLTDYCSDYIKVPITEIIGVPKKQAIMIFFAKMARISVD